MLEALYGSLKRRAPLADLEAAEGYAQVYEEHGWSTHAAKIRENTDLDVPMDEVREKLRNLREFMPGQDESLYEFGQLLAERLNPSLVPEGFVISAQLMLYDLQQGVNGFTGERIHSHLVGQPAMFYNLLGMYIPRIVDAVCPPIFNDKVTAFTDRVAEDARERHAEERRANPPKPIEIDLREYLQRVHAIQCYIVDTLNEADEYGRSRPSQDTPNPFYYQVEPNGGIALIMYYSTPSGLGTPLGEVRIAEGSGSSVPTEVMDSIKDRLGLVEIVPKKITVEGEFGPIYAVTKDLDENPIPQAVLTKRASYIEYEEARRLWDENLPEGREDSGALLRRFAADDAILEERGRLEPKLHEGDISSLEEFRALETPFIKYTRDDGKTWHYAKVPSYEPQVYGTTRGEVTDNSVSVNDEVMPNTKVHAMWTITENDFRDEIKGRLKIRPATSEEVVGIKFSYGSTTEEEEFDV